MFSFKAESVLANWHAVCTYTGRLCDKQSSHPPQNLVARSRTARWDREEVFCIFWGRQPEEVHTTFERTPSGFPNNSNVPSGTEKETLPTVRNYRLQSSEGELEFSSPNELQLACFILVQHN